MREFVIVAPLIVIITCAFFVRTGDVYKCDMWEYNSLEDFKEAGCVQDFEQEMRMLTDLQIRDGKTI